MNSLLKKGIGGVILASIVAGVLFVPVADALTDAQIKNIAGRTGESEQAVRDNLDADSSWESYYINSGFTEPGYVPDSKSPTAADQNKPNKPPADKGKITTKGCFGNPLMGQSLINFDGCAALVANLVMWIAARVLWLAGGILNIAIGRTLDMAGLLKDLPIVDIGWKIIRDISNIVFIFIALWSGISITLGLGDNGSKGWGLLAHMVLVALFINFSLFITKAVVDASNIAALHFYNLIRTEGQGDAWDGGLSSAFMQGLRIQTIYDPATLRGGGQGANTSSYTGGAINMLNIILIGFFGSIFMLVAAFVFFAAAIMFIIRIITLVMLMVLSPLAFVAWLLPGASGLASTWWSKLWSQSFFAPLYLALAYIVVATINSPAFRDSFDKLANQGTMAAALTGTTYTPVLIIFNFIILIGLMVGCLVVAQSLGARGSDLMMSWGQKLKGEGTSFLGRAAVRGVHISEDSKLLDNFVTRRMGVAETLKHKYGGKEFGLRKLNEVWEKSRLGQGAMGRLLREQTTGRLAAAKFGGSKSAEEAYEEHEEMASKRKEIEFGATATKNAKPLADLRDEERGHLDKKLEAEKEVEAIKREIRTKKKNGEDTTADEEELKKKKEVVESKKQKLEEFRKTKSKDMEQYTANIRDALSQMSTEGFMNMQKTFFTKAAVMDLSVLGQDKFSALMKSEHFTRPEKEEYTHARWERTNEAAKRRKTRNEWYLEGQTEHQTKLEEYQAKLKDIEEELELPKLEDDLKKDLAELNQNLKTFTDEVADLEHQEGVDPAALKWSKEKVANTKQEIANRKYKFEKEKTDKIAARDARVKDENLVKPEKEMSQPGWEEVPDIRKALRNIMKPDEVVNLYRYDREAFSNPFIADTIKQGTWNLVRGTGEIDSNSIEQARVDKRHYVQHAGDLDAGLDTLKIQELEKKNPGAAKEIREKFHKQLVAVGHADYFKHFDDEGDENGEWEDELGRKWDCLGKILKKALTDNGLSDDVDIEERRFRSRTGNSMYEEVALNLANDEFQMMPGILRNMLIVRRHLGRSTAPDYDKRDLEDTLPHVETWLEEFKRALLGQGEITRGTLEVLNWLVNEDRGQRFTKFESLRPDLKPVFEIVKGFVANTARAQRSIHPTLEALLAAVEDLKRTYGAESVPLENFFAQAGMIGELFKVEKEKK